MSTIQSTKLGVSLEHEERAEKGRLDSVPATDPATEKRLLQKLDWHLLPPLMAVFFLSFMDRTNIGLHSDYFFVLPLSYKTMDHPANY